MNTTASPDLGWIEMAGRRHGLSAGNAGTDDLAELEEFILAAGRAREATGIDPNTSMHLAGIWQDRNQPDWAGKHGLVRHVHAWPMLDAETMRTYLEALEAWFTRRMAGPDEYTLVVQGHRWRRHPCYRNTEYCRGCGLTLMLEQDGRGKLLGAQISRTRQGAVEITGRCGGERRDWDWGYFLPAPHGTGMRRVDSEEWYGEIKKQREG